MMLSKTIQPGEQIPDLPVWCVGAKIAAPVNLAHWLGGGRNVLFCLPGAFTPTCNNFHLPGYISSFAEFKALGVDNIICASVNDHFVMRAWANSQNAMGKIEFLADFDAKLAKAFGLLRDLSAGGLGERFARAAMIIENGLIQAIFVDEKSGELTKTSAASMLGVLRGLYAE